MKVLMNDKVMPILVEKNSDAGVHRIAQVMAKDIALVTGITPDIISEEDIEMQQFEQVIVVATYGKSALLKSLENSKKLDFSGIAGKWECYQTALVEAPFEHVAKAVVIAGSDKRGTIYGMFSLSEEIGVSPLVFLGDVKPVKKLNAELSNTFFKTSKEPSVKYRGFFINDEWPCFGNWVTKHYGDFNAKAYEEIFLFLLRMKGNYMWPAMWSASFSLDGPGSANEELADLLGVVMGYSHHEPCLRASEEWDKVRGEDSIYGNDWNYVKNEKGLLKYWEDALIRSGKYDNMITIGMRGERDTSMLGEDSTMQENVELLKKIITNQKKMIEEHVKPYRPNAPMLLALYKEVEQYFYGDATIEGLQNWDGLEDVVCMLCEDNHGYMRTLPTQKMRDKKQKFGMYYHFDYHGDPVSYEWLDSTPFTKTWEQMGQAYEFGIREVWIVNVGDLKFHEVPLTYFMELAYDFEKWGTSNLNSVNEYLEKFTKQNFPEAEETIQEKIAFVLREYIDLNHLRRPEFLHENDFHPVHFNETDRMIKRTCTVTNTTSEILSGLRTKEEKDAFYSCIGFSALASMNHIRLHLYTGKNQHYAKQGRKIANEYKRLAEAAMKKDRELYEDWARFLDGKWDGMQMASHVGFTKWNDMGRKNPVLYTVYPIDAPRMNVSRKDEEPIYDKIYGPAMKIEVPDFKWPKCERVTLEIANDGASVVHFSIAGKEGEIPEWIVVSKLSGDVETLEKVHLELRREYMKNEEEETTLLVSDSDTVVQVHISAKKFENLFCDSKKDGEGGYTFYPEKHAVIMRADHYFESKQGEKAAFSTIHQYGNYGVGCKAFPVTEYFTKDNAPSLTYRFYVEKAGEYEVRLFMTPSNPSIKGEAVHVFVGTDTLEELEILPTDYQAGVCADRKWSEGVLKQIRTVSMKKEFKEGFQTVTISPKEPGFVLQQVGIYDCSAEEKLSYLGQEESFWIN